jgi:hypothetical protein
VKRLGAMLRARTRRKNKILIFVRFARIFLSQNFKVVPAGSVVA